MYKKLLKRPFDLIFSLVMLILLFPLFIVISIIIQIDSRGPIFFTQTSVGKNEKKFNILKFRTMKTIKDSYYKDGTEMNHEDRVTRVGRILRKISFDELPQLINILLGTMSIIGPRPTLPYQVVKYNDYQKQRLLVRPGVTGLAQVNGRNNLTWNEKIDFDIKYINKLTLFNDIKIFLKTFLVVLKKDNVKFKKHDDISQHEGSTIKDIVN